MTYIIEKILETLEKELGIIDNWLKPQFLHRTSSKGNFFAWVYKSLLSNKAISVVNDQISNPTYVYHLFHTIFQCIILNTEGIYHYGSDEYIKAQIWHNHGQARTLDGNIDYSTFMAFRITDSV